VGAPPQNGCRRARLNHNLRIHIATPGGGQGGRGRRGPRTGPVALVLAGLLLAALLLGGGCQRRAPAAVPLRLEPTPPGGRLQEVAPPPAVQQLEAGLATHEPQLVIEAPADGSNLPSGNWNLRLRVRDWPLVDGGPLGLGPHLAVQIDDHPLLRLTQHHSTPTGDVLETRLPPLGAGSHTGRF
jgi:hypothetical protein